MSKPGLTLAQMPEESMFGLDNGQGLGRYSEIPLSFLRYFLNLGHHEGRLLRNLEFLLGRRNMLQTLQVLIQLWAFSLSHPTVFSRFIGGQNEKKNPWSWESSTTAATAKSFDEVPCAYQSSSTASMIQATKGARSSEVLEQSGKLELFRVADFE